VSLFDGQTLAGWHGDPRLWRVVDGAIVGSTKGVNFDSQSYLCTVKRYRDFILKVRFKLHKGKSAIKFRSQQLAHYQAAGYQAEVGWQYRQDRPGQVIALYSDGPKKETKRTDRDEYRKHFKEQEWNEYVITYRGPHITLQLNGYTTVDYIEDQPAPNEGIIGFQLLRRPRHGLAEVKVEFKDIRVKELSGAAPQGIGSTSSATDAATRPAATETRLPAGLHGGPARSVPPGWISLFDGKTLAGWRSVGGPEAWSVDNGEVRGDGPKNTIFTSKEYGAFELQADVKLGAGAYSGIIFHAGRKTWGVADVRLPPRGPQRGCLALQARTRKVSFRNAWIKPL
jgi:3-keto-disaccharide hydrolase